MTGRIAIDVAVVGRDHDRALGDRLHRDDADLGHVDDRHHQVGAEAPGVVDGERAAAEVVEPELVRPGPGRDVEDRGVEAVDRELVRVPDHRHDQAVVDRDRHADVDPALGQQALVGPVGVERRVALERLDAGLDHERDVAQRDAFLGLVVPLGALAERDEAVASTSICT